MLHPSKGRRRFIRLLRSVGSGKQSVDFSCPIPSVGVTRYPQNSRLLTRARRRWRGGWHRCRRQN